MSSNQRSTDNLLRRYLNGALTAPEEAELERRARTDEPLAEAMKGLQSDPEEDHEARVARMLQGARTQVQGKVGGARVKPLPRRNYARFAAAASVILLFISCALWFLPRWLELESLDMTMETAAEAPLTEPTNTPVKDEVAVAGSISPELELETETEVTSPAPPSPTPNLRPRPKTTPSAPTEAEVQTEASTRKRAQEKVLRDQVARRASAVEDRIAATAQAEAQEDAANISEEEVAAEAAPPAVPAVASAPLQPPVISGRTEDLFKAEADEIVARAEKRRDYLEGRITNENGYPILNALVRLPGLPIGERTDSNGYFRLPADATTSRIEISHPDYEDEAVGLRNRPENLQVSLDRKEWQSERSKLTQGAAHTIIKLDDKPGYAAPLEGYGNLRKRLEDNKPENIPAGKVKFSFTVNTDGTLTDFEFRGKPGQETMDYIGGTIVKTSVWEITQGEEPVRVYMKVVF